MRACRCLMGIVVLIAHFFCNATWATEPTEVVEVLWDMSGDNIEWLLVSPDNSSVAVAVRSAGISVYKDKVKIGTYERALNPMFSNNSRAFAFLVIDAGKVFFVVDGQELPPLNVPSDATTNPQLLSFALASVTAFNFDGTALAYRDFVGLPAPPSANSHLFSVQDQAIYVNGKPGVKHPEVGPPVFNPVKNELIYRVRDNGIKQAYLIQPGVQSNRYISIIDPVLFNASGMTVAFIAQADISKFVIVINGIEQPDTYNFASGLTFSPDGKRVAFVAGLPGTSNQYAVVDGKRGPSFNYVDPVTFSHDGSRYGYVANTNISLGIPGTNETIIIVDGKEVARQKDARAFGPFLGPNGKTAFVTQAGVRSYITIDGKRQGPYGSVGFPVFSGTGKHVAYAMVDGISNKLKMVIDETASPSYAAVSVPRFDGDNKVEYYAVKTGERLSVVRVTKTF